MLKYVSVDHFVIKNRIHNCNLLIDFILFQFIPFYFNLLYFILFCLVQTRAQSKAATMRKRRHSCSDVVQPKKIPARRSTNIAVQPKKKSTRRSTNFTSSSTFSTAKDGARHFPSIGIIFSLFFFIFHFVQKINNIQFFSSRTIKIDIEKTAST